MSETERDVLDRLVKDMTHLANALRKRGHKYEEQARSLEWCAAKLAAVKEARA